MISHRRRSTPPMRPDDRVGPGLRRRLAIGLTGLALLGFGVAIPLAFQTVNQDTQAARQDANLSQAEVTELRSYLTERRAVREKESAEVDRRLDEQSAALCAALAEVSRDATTSGRRALARAGQRLDCSPLPPRRTSSPASTTSSSSTSSDGTSQGAPSREPEPEASPSPTSDAGASSPAPDRTSTPRPRPSPSPSTPPMANPPERTCTVQVLGLCL